MNATQKLALQEYHPRLLQDLELNTDLIGKFIHHGIFNEDMIDEFKTEKTRRGQIQKMLLQLPRRGPRAFDMFIHTIQEHYPWLAEGLRDTLHTISSNKDPEPLSLKEKVDIFVHEQFGSSKRLCEEDKRFIRKFMYRHLKQQADLHGTCPQTLHKPHPGHTTPLEQDIEKQAEQRDKQLKQDIETQTEHRIYQKVYAILNKDETCIDTDEHNTTNSTIISFDMIENKVNELNNTVESLQQEVKSCLTVLGLDNSEYSLRDVLETYVEKHNSDIQVLKQMKDKIDNLEWRRNKLEEELKVKEKELNDCMKKLSTIEHENEKTEVLMRELQEKCYRLEQLHIKHVEKQQTLMVLKNMVNDLSPHQRQVYPDRLPADEVDGQHVEMLQLPKLGTVRASRAQHSRQINKSGYRERSRSHHHELPRLEHWTGKPWK